MKLEKHKLCRDNVFLCHDIFALSQQMTNQVLIDFKNICHDTIFLCRENKKGINLRLVLSQNLMKSQQIFGP